MANQRTERSFGRSSSQMRPITLRRNVLKHAAGSCMVEFGDTHVLCAATVEDVLPPWRRGGRDGWVTAEYSMLPASTNRRSPREYRGRKGRSMEIERLIGRSLRTVVDLRLLGERTVTIDCDVIQADGGTRTASVTGAWVALHDALRELTRAGELARIPLKGQVAAVSTGVVDGRLLLDLDYGEDSSADVDLNVVGTTDGRIIEIQGTGEKAPFDRSTLDGLLDLGQMGLAKIMDMQRQVTNWSA